MKRYEIVVNVNDVSAKTEVPRETKAAPKPPQREFVEQKRITINGVRFTRGEPYLFGWEEGPQDIHFHRLENKDLGVSAYLGFQCFRVFARVSEIYDDGGILFYYGDDNGRLILIESGPGWYKEHEMGPVFNWNRKPIPHHLCNERVSIVLTSLQGSKASRGAKN